MVKLKIDGEVLEYSNWVDVHDDYASFSEGRCDSQAESHCGGSESCNGECCDCHRSCVINTLDANHNWKEIKK